MSHVANCNELNKYKTPNGKRKMSHAQTVKLMKKINRMVTIVDINKNNEDRVYYVFVWCTYDAIVKSK